MLAAFRWNLRVLSYIALVVGAFLIYNTISVSVVRRRAEIGILRALGATRAGSAGGVSWWKPPASGWPGGMRGRGARAADGRGLGAAGGRHGRIAVCQQPPGADRAHVDRRACGIAIGVGGRGAVGARACMGGIAGRSRWKRWRAAAAITTSACTSGATWPWALLLRGRGVARLAAAGR